ncbi:hypothetical protein [Faecalibacter sp. LW9]|uniref:hypothetical protein n=1 Tax=Faecalibacter sp. LW9 TaxID=3103144 RepID=UPI002AFDF162|nr:hypothetical protein [Faecalibacter sp. LW9]
MKSLYIIILFLGGVNLNAQENKVKNLKNIKVVNRIDPICGMDNTKYLKDTAIYQKKVYGFCGSHCKIEFKKSTKKKS